MTGAFALYNMASLLCVIQTNFYWVIGTISMIQKSILDDHSKIQSLIRNSQLCLCTSVIKYVSIFPNQHGWFCWLILILHQFLVWWTRSLRLFNLASLMYWQYIYTCTIIWYNMSCKPFLLIKFHCFSFAVIEMTMQKTSLQNSILTDSIRSHFKTHLDRNKTILISHCQNFLNRTLQKI